MRPQHQKSRSRGRGRKPQNPLSRNYESNGPDVKIRGNAGHIAEKYSTLARDALSNGDTVMAENYFQHAEHYNRIVAAAQAQRAEEQAANGRGPQPDADDANASDGNDAQSVEGVSETSDEVSADDNDEAVKAKPQKSGRGRRPRKPVEADAGGNGSEASDKNANGKSEEAENPAVPVEAMSEDAAKLPESIRGGFLGDDG